MKKHIIKTFDNSQCGEADLLLDKFVDAALESDCDKCRTAVGVGRVGEELWSGGKLGTRQSVAPYQPQPWTHIKTLEEERKERDAETALMRTTAEVKPKKMRKKK